MSERRGNNFGQHSLRPAREPLDITQALEIKNITTGHIGKPVRGQNGAFQLDEEGRVVIEYWNEKGGFSHWSRLLKPVVNGQIFEITQWMPPQQPTGFLARLGLKLPGERKI